MHDIFRTWRSTSGIRLISGLLKYDLKQRLTADEALRSSYFTELVSLHELTIVNEMKISSQYYFGFSLHLHL